MTITDVKRKNCSKKCCLPLGTLQHLFVARLNRLRLDYACGKHTKIIEKIVQKSVDMSVFLAYNRDNF